MRPIAQQVPPSTIQSLSSETARKLLRTHGPNELPRTGKKSAIQTAWTIVTEPMLLLLLACGATYFLIGEIREATLLLSSALIAGGLTWIQEVKSEHALQRLRSLASPRARVIRDGVEKNIPSAEVVPGDLLILKEGDRIPADAVILKTEHCEVDESLLTGEALPVTKSAHLPKYSQTVSNLS